MADNVLVEIYNNCAQTASKDEAVVLKEMIELLDTQDAIVERLKQRLPQYSARFIHQTMLKAYKYKRTMVGPYNIAESIEE